MTAERTWIVQNDLGPVGVYITRRLTALSAGHHPKVIVAPRHPEVSPIDFLKAEEPTAIILGGSLSSAVEPEPWMDWEYDLIREAVRTSVPLLGLCFGHQAIASAMGGKVERRQMQRGPKVIVPEGESILFRGVTDWRFVGTHEDHVTQLPPGFRRIATSDYCAIQGIQHASSPVFGVQFHPCYDGAAAQVKELGLTDQEAYANGDGVRLVRNFLAFASQRATGKAHQMATS